MTGESKIFTLSDKEKELTHVALAHHTDFLEESIKKQTRKKDKERLQERLDIAVALVHKLDGVTRTNLMSDAEMMNELQKHGVIY